MVNEMHTKVQRPSVSDKRRAFRALHQQGCFVQKRDDIAALVRAVSPKPLNVVMSAPGLTVAELAELGVRRISIGGALARVAWAAAIGAAEKIKGGSFDGLAGGTPGARLNAMFGQFD
jgi:hypothetical protein